jgi:hypothetical protein
MAFLLWLSSSGFPPLAFLLWLSSSGFPPLAFLLWLSSVARKKRLDKKRAALNGRSASAAAMTRDTMPKLGLLKFHIDISRTLRQWAANRNVDAER